MAERRKFKRKDLLFYARVYDSKSGRTIGNLLNITPDGAMVLSEKPVDSDLEMELHIELPDGIATKQEMIFSAKTLWCAPDINPEFYDVGFHFAEVSDEDGKIIQRMIEEYGFRE